MESKIEMYSKYFFKYNIKYNIILLYCSQTLYDLRHCLSHHIQFSSVQSLSRVQLFATP